MAMATNVSGVDVIMYISAVSECVLVCSLHLITCRGLIQQYLAESCTDHRAHSSANGVYTVIIDGKGFQVRYVRRTWPMEKGRPGNQLETKGLVGGGIMQRLFCYWPFTPKFQSIFSRNAQMRIGLIWVSYERPNSSYCNIYVIFLMRLQEKFDIYHSWSKTGKIIAGSINGTCHW